MKILVTILLPLLSSALERPAEAGLRDCLGYFHRLLFARAPQLPPPLPFYLSFKDRSEGNSNIFDWPGLRSELHRLRDLARKASLDSPPDDSLARILGRLDEATAANHLDYPRYLRLFVEASAAVSRAFDPYHPPTRVEDALAAVDSMTAKGLLVVPIVRDEPLGQRELLRAAAAGVVYLQLPSAPTRADGILRSPFQFVTHDIAHGLQIAANLTRRLQPARADGSPDDGERILAGIAVFSRLVERAAAIGDTRLREDVNEAFFNYVHEFPVIGTLESFLASLRGEMNGPLEAVDPFRLIPRRPGEDVAAFRARYAAVERWFAGEIRRLNEPVP